MFPLLPDLYAAASYSSQATRMRSNYPLLAILFVCQYLPGIQMLESITLELPIKRLTNASWNVTRLLLQTTNGLNGSISAGKHAFSRYVLPKA